MVATLGDMIKGTYLISNIIVWAISKSAHILAHLQGRSDRPGRRSPRGGKVNILSKKNFLRSTHFKLLRRINLNSINVIEFRNFCNGRPFLLPPPPPACIKPSYATVHVHILTEQRNLLVLVALISAGERNVDS
jgi:hypothetical protein